MLAHSLKPMPTKILTNPSKYHQFVSKVSYFVLHKLDNRQLFRI